jgi:hypothetical protein
MAVNKSGCRAFGGLRCYFRDKEKQAARGCHPELIRIRKTKGAADRSAAPSP